MRISVIPFRGAFRTAVVSHSSTPNMESSDSLCPFGLPRGCSHLCQPTTSPGGEHRASQVPIHPLCPACHGLKSRRARAGLRPLAPCAVLPSTSLAASALATLCFSGPIHLHPSGLRPAVSFPLASRHSLPPAVQGSVPGGRAQPSRAGFPPAGPV